MHIMHFNVFRKCICLCTALSTARETLHSDGGERACYLRNRMHVTPVLLVFFEGFADWVRAPTVTSNLCTQSIRMV